MRASTACFDLIKRFEGLRLDSYRCLAGIPTVGYGHTRGVMIGLHVSPEFAEELLREDIEAVEDGLARALHVTVTQGQWDALVSFAFNCKGWRDSTLLRLINAGCPLVASDEFPKWNHVSGKVNRGLTTRREAERKLFLS